MANDPHRYACQRQHRIVAHYLAVQAWLRKLDCIVLDHVLMEMQVIRLGLSTALHRPPLIDPFCGEQTLLLKPLQDVDDLVAASGT